MKEGRILTTCLSCAHTTPKEVEGTESEGEKETERSAQPWTEGHALFLVTTCLKLSFPCSSHGRCYEREEERIAERQRKRNRDTHTHTCSNSSRVLPTHSGIRREAHTPSLRPVSSSLFFVALALREEEEHGQRDSAFYFRLVLSSSHTLHHRDKDTHTLWRCSLRHYLLLRTLFCVPPTHSAKLNCPHFCALTTQKPRRGAQNVQVRGARARPHPWMC